MEITFTSISFFKMDTSEKTGKPFCTFSARIPGNDAGFIACIMFDDYLIKTLLHNHTDNETKYNIAGKFTNKSIPDKGGKNRSYANLEVYGLGVIPKSIWDKTKTYNNSSQKSYQPQVETSAITYGQVVLPSMTHKEEEDLLNEALGETNLTTIIENTKIEEKEIPTTIEESNEEVIDLD